jgi:hypothetical protein
MKQLNPFAAPNDIFGLQVVMPSACPKCRSRMAVIRPDKKPYIASLICARCRRHREWMAEETIDFVNSIISTFGRPTAPVVLRSPPASGAVRCQPGHRSSLAPGGHRDGR